MSAPDFDAIGPAEFVRTIHGDAFTPDRAAVVFLKGADIRWCGSPEQVAQSAEQFDPRGDTYVSCCLMDAAAEAPGKRGSAEHTVAMGAVWADIDVGTDGHKGKTYPPSIEEALDHIAHRIEQRPSIVVHTGGGVHLWWLLDEPLILESQADHTFGAELVRRWQAHLREVFAEKGWALDSTHDLARVLRLPGTHNHKYSPPRPVHVTAWDIL